MSFFDQIGQAIAKTVIDAVLPPLVEVIAVEFARHAPTIVEAVVRAVVQTSTTTITDAIPGKVDDVVVGIVKDILGSVFGGK